MYPGRFKNLHLYAPDPYDLILSKLERTASRIVTTLPFWQKASNSVLRRCANATKRNCIRT